jgi:hypothetical protein
MHEIVRMTLPLQSFLREFQALLEGSDGRSAPRRSLRPSKTEIAIDFVVVRSAA